MAESVSMVCWGLISLAASRHLPWPSRHPTVKGKVGANRASSDPVASLYSSILYSASLAVNCVCQLLRGVVGRGVAVSFPCCPSLGVGKAKSYIGEFPAVRKPHGGEFEKSLRKYILF